MTQANDDAAKDARMEWLLRERIGNETPPDLEHAVLAQLQTEPTPVAIPNRNNRLLVAAIVVIGVAAVFAVSQITGDTPAAVSNPQQGEPEFVTWQDPALVRSRQDIEALPADTKQVFGINLDNDALPALLRLRKLEAIALTVSTFEAKRGGPLKPKTDPVYFTDEGFERLASMSSLRALVLEGHIKLKGHGLVRVVKDTGLRELTLTSMAVTDKLLAELAQLPLQALRLHGSQEFGDAGIKAIAASKTLREVSLRGCTHLEQEWIANLANLKSLETLNLSGIGSHTLFSGIRLSPLPEPTPGSGVTDRVVRAVAPLPKLRSLDLGSADVTDKGIAALKESRSLRQLGLQSITELTAAGAHCLPNSLTSLNLLGHRDLDSQLLKALLGRPNLTDLNLGWCRNPSLDAIEQLCKAAHLRTLNVSGWKLTDAERDRLSKLAAQINFGKQPKRR